MAGSIFTCSVSSKTTRKFAPRIDSVTTPSISSMSRSSAERFITGVSERGETEAADNCDVGVTPTTSAERYTPADVSRLLSAPAAAAVMAGLAVTIVGFTATVPRWERAHRAAAGQGGAGGERTHDFTKCAKR